MKIFKGQVQIEKLNSMFPFDNGMQMYDSDESNVYLSGDVIAHIISTAFNHVARKNSKKKVTLDMVLKQYCTCPVPGGKFDMKCTCSVPTHGE